MSDAPTSGPVRVGLVGAGPWAARFTAPLLAEGPHCMLAAVWARRPEKAAELAATHGARAVASLDELFGECEAVAFAVPPDVQAELAVAAARAGRAVLLDKPIGFDLAQAERLAEAIAAAGVVSLMVLTNRYRPSMRAFLDTVPDFAAIAGRATFLGDGSIPGTYFGTPWRLERGGLLDLGPHVFDGLDAALGPIVEVRAAGEPLGVVAVTCIHESGAISQATMSGTIPNSRSGLVVELFGAQGQMSYDSAAGEPDAQLADLERAMAILTAEFASAVRSGTSHPLDVQRGLYLQRLIDSAAAQLSAG